MKKKLLYLLSVLVTLACALGIWFVADKVLIVKRTDGVLPMQDFYAQESGTVDVLIMGSSHAGMNLDVSEFWRRQGQSAYALWGSNQPFWNTYHFLVEALKTQRPKVLVLEVYAAVFDFEYSDAARQVTNICGMNLSLNKWEAIKVSAPKNRWLNLLTGLPVYHNRYSEVNADDFQHFPWSGGLENDKGTYYRYGFGPSPLTDVSDVTERTPLMEKEELYLRKILTLCRDENLPVVLTLTPTASFRADQPFMNTIADIAAEYQVPFYNFNLLWEDAGIMEWDFGTDVHLNTRGARKVSAWLADRLHEDFNLSDHRGDPAYQSWDTHARDVENEYMKLITWDEDYFDEVLRDGYDLIVIRTDTFKLTENGRSLMACLEKIGGDADAVSSARVGCWTYSRNENTPAFREQASEDDVAHFDFDGFHWTVDMNQWEVRCDGESVCALSESGIYTIVIDPQRSRWIDAAAFAAGEDFRVVRSAP